MPDTTTKAGAAVSGLALLIGRQYTADGQTWTVDRLVFPWAPDYPQRSSGIVCVQDREHGGPVVPSTEVAQ